MSEPSRAGAPATSLKDTLERLKRESNVRLDLLKNRNHRRPISELYFERFIELHLHFRAGDLVFDALYRARNLQEPQSVGSVINGQGETALRCGNFPVFVRVGKVAQKSRPIASVVRLESLKSGNASGINSGELGTTSLLPEIRPLVADRELRLLALPRIEQSKFVDKIVKSGPQILGGFSDQDADNYRGGWEAMHPGLRRFIRSVRIEMKGDRLEIFMLEISGDSPKLIDVFFTSINAGERPVELA